MRLHLPPLRTEMQTLSERTLEITKIDLCSVFSHNFYHGVVEADLHLEITS